MLYYQNLYHFLVGLVCVSFGVFISICEVILSCNGGGTVLTPSIILYTAVINPTSGLNP